jgi:chromosome segregation ATPase
MTSKENLQRHLKNIDEQLGSLEYYCDTEIVGDDARHLLSDIKASMREHLRAQNQPLTELSDLKPLYDRLKSVYTSIRVMRNSLTQCEKAIEKAIESCNAIAAHIEEVNEPEDDAI